MEISLDMHAPGMETWVCCVIDSRHIISKTLIVGHDTGFSYIMLLFISPLFWIASRKITKPSIDHPSSGFLA